jgi:hypothetical protein
MPENEKHRTAQIDKTDASSTDFSANFSGGMNESLIRAATAEVRAEVAEFVVSKAEEIAGLVSGEGDRKKVVEAIRQMAVHIQGGNGSRQEETLREDDTD